MATLLVFSRVSGGHRGLWAWRQLRSTEYGHGFCYCPEVGVDMLSVSEWS